MIICFLCPKNHGIQTQKFIAMGTWGENHQTDHIFRSPHFSFQPGRFLQMFQAGYTEKTDIWSFGVMAYALLFNQFPYGAQVRDKDSREVWVNFITTSSYITTKTTIDDGSDSGNRPLLWPPDSG